MLNYLSLCLLTDLYLPHFNGYKMGVFSSRNDVKNLDPSFKMDLDLLGLLHNMESNDLAKIICLRNTYIYVGRISVY